MKRRFFFQIALFASGLASISPKFIAALNSLIPHSFENSKFEEDLKRNNVKGTDYNQLQNFLAAQKWKDADAETDKLILQSANQEEICPISLYAFRPPIKPDPETGEYRGEPIYTNPGQICYLSEDCDFDEVFRKNLSSIDQLWRKYSQGRFGFSIQERIRQEVTDSYSKVSALGYEPGGYQFEKRFAERLGWYKNGAWLSESNLIFSLNAPFGHLPSVPVRGLFEWHWADWEYFYTLVKKFSL